MTARAPVLVAFALLATLISTPAPGTATAPLHFRGVVRTVSVKRGTADVRGGPFAWLPMKLTTTLRLIPAASAKRIHRGDVIDGVVNPNRTPWTLSSVHIVAHTPAEPKARHHSSVRSRTHATPR